MSRKFFKATALVLASANHSFFGTGYGKQSYTMKFTRSCTVKKPFKSGECGDRPHRVFFRFITILGLLICSFNNNTALAQEQAECLVMDGCSISFDSPLEDTRATYNPVIACGGTSRRVTLVAFRVNSAGNITMNANFTANGGGAINGGTDAISENDIDIHVWGPFSIRRELLLRGGMRQCVENKTIANILINILWGVAT